MSDEKDKQVLAVLTIDQLPKHTNQYKDTIYDEDILYCIPNGNTPKRNITIGDHYGMPFLEMLENSKRYQWLRDNVFEVNCEGRPADCIAKWMLPRLVAEDSTGRKYTFSEIIDIQMKRSGNEG